MNRGTLSFVFAMALGGCVADRATNWQSVNGQPIDEGQRRQAALICDGIAKNARQQIPHPFLASGSAEFSATMEKNRAERANFYACMAERGYIPAN